MTELPRSGGAGFAGAGAGAGWPDILVGHAASELTARRLIGQLRACEASALAFCRLLERWGRGDAQPATAGGREAALRHAADRVETALAGLDAPLGRYLLELEADQAEGRSWYTGPGAGELVEWKAVLTRAGVHASPTRVAAAYLELAVLVRALQGLSDAARLDAAPDAIQLTYGDVGISALIEAFATGVPYDEAILNALGVDGDRLNEDWKAWIAGQGAREHPELHVG